MPTYSYRCTTCSHEWDENRPVDQRDSLDHYCPVCTNGYINRVITAAPTHFKGRGFYSTDYRGRS